MKAFLQVKGIYDIQVKPPLPRNTVGKFSVCRQHGQNRRRIVTAHAPRMPLDNLKNGAIWLHRNHRKASQIVKIESDRNYKSMGMQGSKVLCPPIVYGSCRSKSYWCLNGAVEEGPEPSNQSFPHTLPVRGQKIHQRSELLARTG